jgi:hypothetical protein
MLSKFFRKRWSGYDSLAAQKAAGVEGESELLATEGVHVRRRHDKMSTAMLLLTILNVALFMLTSILAIRLNKKPLNAELRATSSYSTSQLFIHPHLLVLDVWEISQLTKRSGPVFDMIDLEPSIKKINGTQKPLGTLSIARQFPNPVADAIWEEDIESIRPIPITKEQIRKLGKNPDTVAKLGNDVWGLGDDAYVATLDVFHVLHCLNTYVCIITLSKTNSCVGAIAHCGIY